MFLVGGGGLGFAWNVVPIWKIWDVGGKVMNGAIHGQSVFRKKSGGNIVCMYVCDCKEGFHQR